MDGLTKLTTKNQSYMPLDVLEKSKTKNTFLSVTKTITQKKMSLLLRKCLIIILDTKTGKKKTTLMIP